MHKYVVTHAGKAHADELYACGILRHTGAINSETKIFRRDPTEGELLDPQVFVIDIGGSLSTAMGNFDHHQLPQGVPECSASLVAKNFVETSTEKSYFELLADQEWFKILTIMDHQGPKALEAYLGAKPQWGMASALHRTVVQAFEDDQTRNMAIELATRAIDDVVSFRRSVAEAGACVSSKIIMRGVTIIRCEVSDPAGLNQWIEENLPSQQVVTITDDPRGEGLVLYRHRSAGDVIDLSGLGEVPGVKFAHGGGFLAVLETKDVQVALSILEKAKFSQP